MGVGAQGIVFGGARLPDRWLSGTLVFAIGILCIDSNEVCWLVCSGTEGSSKVLRDKKILIAQNQQLAVFINDVEVVDFPKRFTAAFVGMEVLNSFLGFGGHALYLTSKCGFELFGSVRNRETTGVSRNLIVGDDEMPSQMVQCGAQVMNCVPAAATISMSIYRTA